MIIGAPIDASHPAPAGRVERESDADARRTGSARRSRAHVGIGRRQHAEHHRPGPPSGRAPTSAPARPVSTPLLAVDGAQPQCGGDAIERRRRRTAELAADRDHRTGERQVLATRDRAGRAGDRRRRRRPPVARVRARAGPARRARSAGSSLGRIRTSAGRSELPDADAPREVVAPCGHHLGQQHRSAIGTGRGHRSRVASTAGRACTSGGSARVGTASALRAARRSTARPTTTAMSAGAAIVSRPAPMPGERADLLESAVASPRSPAAGSSVPLAHRPVAPHHLADRADRSPAVARGGATWMTTSIDRCSCWRIAASGQVGAACSDERLEPQQRVERTVGVTRRDRSVVAGVHRLDQCEHLVAAHLADDDAVGPQPERGPHEVGQLDRRRAVGERGSRLEAHRRCRASTDSSVVSSITRTRSSAATWPTSAASSDVLPDEVAPDTITLQRAATISRQQRRRRRRRRSR